MDNVGFDENYYKQRVLDYIKKFGRVTREELHKLLMDQLPNVLNEEQKKRRIKYIVNEKLCKKNKIKNIGTTINI